MTLYRCCNEGFNDNLRILALLLIALAVNACHHKVKTDAPLTRAAAITIAETRLPLPPHAKNVEFFLTGETQNWTLFVTFEAPLIEIEAQIASEIAVYQRNAALAKEPPSTVILKAKLGDHTIPAQYEALKPDWWVVERISAGYFTGAYGTFNYGPRVWVDTKAERAFFFEHY